MRASVQNKAGRSRSGTDSVLTPPSPRHRSSPPRETIAAPAAGAPHGTPQPEGLRAAPSSLGPALLPNPAHAAILQGSEPRAAENRARCPLRGSGARSATPGAHARNQPRPATPALPCTARAAQRRTHTPAALSCQPQRVAAPDPAARRHPRHSPPSGPGRAGRDRVSRGDGGAPGAEPSPRFPAAKLPPPPPGEPRTADGGSAPAARAPPPPGGQWAAEGPSDNGRCAREGGPGTAEERGGRAGADGGVDLWGRGRARRCWKCCRSSSALRPL